MSKVVVGLCAPSDVKPLEQALRSAGVSLDPLQVIESDDSTESMARGVVSTDFIMSDGGMDIPGINSGGRVRPFFRNESLADRIGDFAIPDSEIDNYVEALERGKTFVGYFTDDAKIDSIEAAFKAGGITNVRRY